LSQLGQALAQGGQQAQAAEVWQQAQEVIKSIPDEGLQARALSQLGQALAQAGNYEELLRLIWQFWSSARTRDEAFQRFGLVTWLIPQYPEPGTALFEGFAWVDAFLAGERVDTTAATGD
jgi:tetratricopeptide (TPR) repeat protein